jgi:hypothetical protein
MALTAEQQGQFEIQRDITIISQEHNVAMESKRSKLEAVRIAKEVLTENRRSLPVGEREVSAADITAFATTIITYINS